MIELRPVNVKRLELVKSGFVDMMSDYYVPITGKSRAVVEENFLNSINKVIGRKWGLRHQHFREIFLMPDDKKIGLLWYRTHKEEMFSDMAVLQWITTEDKDDLKKYLKEIIESLTMELTAMGMVRMTVESYYQNDDLADGWSELGFEPVRTVMNKPLV